MPLKAAEDGTQQLAELVFSSEPYALQLQPKHRFSATRNPSR